jgi:hypothetical protein
MATTNKLLREVKIFDFLNDLYACLVTAATQTPVMMRHRPHLSRCEQYSQSTEEMKKDGRIRCLQRDVGLRFEVIAQTPSPLFPANSAKISHKIMELIFYSLAAGF